jgi:hypothetical protein
VFDVPFISEILEDEYRRRSKYVPDVLGVTIMPDHVV